MRVLVALLLVGVVGCGGESSPPGEGAVPTPKSSQAKTDKSPAQTANADPVAALEAIGAKIKRNEQGEVVEVSMGGNGPQITDAGLVHLKGLTGLQTLYLDGGRITDAGLVHLKGLTNLKVLSLVGTNDKPWGELVQQLLTRRKSYSAIIFGSFPGPPPAQITDAGLVHLNGLTSLQTLYLGGPKFTDAGLAHLKGMTKLQELSLGYNKQVTDAGVAELKKALPNCKIIKRYEGLDWSNP